MLPHSQQQLGYFDDCKDLEAAKARYKFLAFAFHPDRFPAGDLQDYANQEMKAVNVAYESFQSAAKTTAFGGRQRRGGQPFKQKYDYGMPSWFDDMFKEHGAYTTYTTYGGSSGKTYTHTDRGEPSYTNPVKIKARFDSDCGVCYNTVSEGEEVLWVGKGSVVHEHCWKA